MFFRIIMRFISWYSLSKFRHEHLSVIALKVSHKIGTECFKRIIYCKHEVRLIKYLSVCLLLFMSQGSGLLIE